MQTLKTLCVARLMREDLEPWKAKLSSDLFKFIESEVYASVNHWTQEIGRHLMRNARFVWH